MVVASLDSDHMDKPRGDKANLVPAKVVVRELRSYVSGRRRAGEPPGKAVAALTKQETSTTPETSPTGGSPDGGSMQARLGRVVAVGSWLGVLLVLAGWAVVHAGDLWWPATLLLFGPRWLFALPLVPLLIAALLWRRRSLLVVLLALLLVFGPLMGFHVPWRGSPPAAPPGWRVRVLTCNIHYKIPVKSPLQRLLADASPDIVAIQELPRSKPFDYSDYFAEDEWYVHPAGGLFLASRYPIRKADSLGGRSMRVPGLLMRYELETPAGLVALFSLHFASPREGLYGATHQPVGGIAELEENSAVRLRQSENLVGLADAETGPVLLMGDFNTPSESAIYCRVWSRYRDAFAEAGWGWGYTFYGGKTAVRIDHVLTGPGWYCEQCWVGPSIGSPHHPLLADLVLVETRP
jgi:vancomycin resistance protein VanJ